MTDCPPEFTFYDNIKTIANDLICGAIAGSMGIFVGVPFDFVKVRMQTSPESFKSTYDCVVQSIRNEGIRGLYKGATAPILSQGGVNALLFAGEAVGMKFLQPDLKSGEKGDAFNIFLAGSFGGFIQCTLLVPSDVIKCHMQVDGIFHKEKPRYNGMFGCASTIYKSEGLKGFYRGFFVTALREIPSIGIYFSVYRHLKDFLTPKGQESSSLVTMAAGGLAGCASWTFVYPVDVIKSNMQVDLPLKAGELRPATTLAMTKYLYRHHGSSVFFNGLGATVARALPVNAVTFVIYEYLRKHYT